jgi:drug/metabolite transporter (DMT)-like permease
VLSAYQLGAATCMLLVLAPLSGAPQTPDGGVLAAVIILGALGTGIAYVLNYQLIRDEGPIPASAVTYLLPIVSVSLGTLILGEPATPLMLLGTAAIPAGIVLIRARALLR